MRGSDRGRGSGGSSQRTEDSRSQGKASDQAATASRNYGDDDNAEEAANGFEVEEGEDDEDAMAAMMGFGGFGTTKVSRLNKRVVVH